MTKKTKDWKKDYAVEQYKNGEFSFGQAAKFADVSVWDFPSLLKKYNVPLNLNKEEFEEELKTVEWILQKNNTSEMTIHQNNQRS